MIILTKTNMQWNEKTNQQNNHWSDAPAESPCIVYHVRVHIQSGYDYQVYMCIS